MGGEVDPSPIGGGGGMENFAGGSFLLGGANLWRSDFDHSNLFQN